MILKLTTLADEKILVNFGNLLHAYFTEYRKWMHPVYENSYSYDYRGPYPIRVRIEDGRKGRVSTHYSYSH